MRWRASRASRSSSKTELRKLVKDLLALAEKEGKDLGKPLGFCADPVDLDAFYEVVVDRLLDAVARQQGMLIRAFDKFALTGDNDDGLKFDEFEQLHVWCCGTRLDKAGREQAFKALLKAGADEDSNGEIDNGSVFSICVMRSKDSLLARPRETRAYWALPWDIEL